MPLSPGTRYRVKTTSNGKRLRLAFRGNKVVEVKRLRDRARRRVRNILSGKS